MDSSSHRSTTAEGTAFCHALGALARDARLRNACYGVEHSGAAEGLAINIALPESHFDSLGLPRLAT